MRFSSLVKNLQELHTTVEGVKAVVVEPEVIELGDSDDSAASSSSPTGPAAPAGTAPPATAAD